MSLQPLKLASPKTVRRGRTQLNGKSAYEKVVKDMGASEDVLTIFESLGDVKCTPIQSPAGDVLKKRRAQWKMERLKGLL
ncbi:hypothetical protein [Alicyclobacillus dauci]|uniref:Transposase n=1 Tax=Alicyclobacillus dauci TaxID=1475485 RepID=A0ABY6Z4V7_9BACL|nr:hypothetical protein [Alicyclobacillus dauci]WAH37795.1 hypothetical protein NZD86_04630 [Alicyclobacillus dauci]